MDGGGTDTIGLGVLGCADIADRRVLPAVAATEGIRVAAVGSRDRGRAGRFARRHGGAAVEGYDAVLRRDDVHAVYVPLPAGLHAGWIERALLAGRHVLAEKPMTTSATDTGRLVALAGRLGLVLRENVMFCHHPRHDAVRRLVDDGAIGELRSFAATFAVPQRPDGDVRLHRDLGGGALFDTGVYPLRAARMFLGPGLAVRGAALRGAPSGVDLGGTALLVRPADGVSASLAFGLCDAYRSAYSLAGSTGRIEVGHAFTPPADHEPVVSLTTSSGTEAIPLAAHDQYRTAVRAFVDAVHGGAGPPEWEPAASVDQALTTDRIRGLARVTGPPTHDHPERR